MVSNRIRVEGQVQGVGFRPFVSRLAIGLSLKGWVRNEGGAVEIHVEGSQVSLREFTKRLRTESPSSARIDRIITAAPLEGTPALDFRILPSTQGSHQKPQIPPDRPICPACLEDMANPQSPRHHYAFTHCADCGPRYTIISDFPFDRARTSMDPFPMCPRCQAEYADPEDRRFHAEIISCPVCGPRLTLVQGGTELLGEPSKVMNQVGRLLNSGAILAVRGVGGYHLICDARAESVIERIRSAKNRPSRPFAVMISRDDPKQLIPEPYKGYLRAKDCPIVLVPKNLAPDLAANVAPGLSEVGLMLPHSPLHAEIVRTFGGALIVTSANPGGEPILTGREEAESLLSDVADAFLHHDREILRPADDSVVRLIAGEFRPLRQGRGSAPHTFRLKENLPIPLLATGADLKNTLALAEGQEVFIGPHLGNLVSLRSRHLFLQLIEDFKKLFAVTPRAVITDAHPDFHASVWAETLNLPIYHVYHHHAHASAVYGEFECEDRLLVFAFDGMGWGPDQTIWGGEALLGRPGAWRHLGGMRPFALQGGERASSQIWRSARALALAAGVKWNPEGIDLDVSGLLSDDMTSLKTSSVGRLFEGVAALSGVCHQQQHEGHAAMLLESLAVAGADPVLMPIEKTSGLYRWDWSSLVALMASGGLSASEKSSIFHASLAEGILSMALMIRENFGISSVGFSGGVFQNAKLTSAAWALLGREGFEVLIPKRFPVNDAAISFGQIVEASAVLRAKIGSSYGEG